MINQMGRFGSKWKSSILKKYKDEWMEQAGVWENSEAVGPFTGTEVMKEQNLVLEVGFFDTHQWWMSKTFPSKNGQCLMTRWLPKWKGRDESRHDSYILKLSDQEKTPSSPRLPPLTWSQPSGFQPWLTRKSPLSQYLTFFPVSLLVSFLDLTLRVILLKTLPSLAFRDWSWSL